MTSYYTGTGDVTRSKPASTWKSNPPYCVKALTHLLWTCNNISKQIVAKEVARWRWKYLCNCGNRWIVCEICCFYLQYWDFQWTSLFIHWAQSFSWEDWRLWFGWRKWRHDFWHSEEFKTVEWRPDEKVKIDCECVDQFSLVAPLFFVIKVQGKSLEKACSLLAGSTYQSDPAWIFIWTYGPSNELHWTQSVGSTLVLESICINRMAINFLCQC